MQRRQFLKSAGAAAGFATVLQSQALAGFVESPRMAFFRATGNEAGSAFVPILQAACEACKDESLQVFIDGLQSAEGGTVLEGLSMRVMFDLPDGTSVGFEAWRYDAGPVPSQTDSARFIAGRSTVRRLELDVRVRGAHGEALECCSLTPGDTGLLSPGQYVLLGPRRDGSIVGHAGLVYSGNPRAPLDMPGRDFDYLPVRVEALA